MEDSRHRLTMEPGNGGGESPIRNMRISSHLFWDVRVEEIDPDKHAAWLARRVLEYGDWPDWQALVRYYGRSRMAEIVTGIRSLQPRALAFCKVWFDLPGSAFRCSTHPQSLETSSQS